jgi:hypothetical protein
MLILLRKINLLNARLRTRRRSCFSARRWKPRGPGQERQAAVRFLRSWPQFVQRRDGIMRCRCTSGAYPKAGQWSNRSWPQAGQKGRGQEASDRVADRAGPPAPIASGARAEEPGDEEQPDLRRRKLPRPRARAEEGRHVPAEAQQEDDLRPADQQDDAEPGRKRREPPRRVPVRGFFPPAPPAPDAGARKIGSGSAMAPLPSTPPARHR